MLPDCKSNRISSTLLAVAQSRISGLNSLLFSSVVHLESLYSHLL